MRMKRKKVFEKDMKRCRDELTEREKVQTQEDCRCWASLAAFRIF